MKKMMLVLFLLTIILGASRSIGAVAASPTFAQSMLDETISLVNMTPSDKILPWCTGRYSVQATGTDYCLQSGGRWVLIGEFRIVKYYEIGPQPYPTYWCVSWTSAHLYYDPFGATDILQNYWVEDEQGDICASQIFSGFRAETIHTPELVMLSGGQGLHVYTTDGFSYLPPTVTGWSPGSKYTMSYYFPYPVFALYDRYKNFAPIQGDGAGFPE